MASQSNEPLPERPKESKSETPDSAAAPSKGALKKAAKEKEKAEKAAKRAEQERQQKEQADTNDTAKHLYGKMPDGISEVGGQASQPPLDLRDLNEQSEGKEITIEAVVHNARVQSAKLAFLDLRQPYENIQAVIAEGGKYGISRQMVKWCGGLNRETLVQVRGLVQKPKDPINSATVSNLELHVERVFIVAEGPMALPMQVKDAMHHHNLGEEETEGQVDSSGAPIVNLSTRLNNRVLDLRTPISHAIFEINAVIVELYREFMLENKFREIFTPKTVGAATEGGSNVFEIKYFDKAAYLSQSPQFYKQMAISAGRERVFEIGPVFRAENSNTPRHLTEFTGLDFEMRIHNKWDEVIDMAEDLMLFIFRGLRQRCTYEMEAIRRYGYPDAGNFQIPEGRAPRLRFADGIKMLHEAGYEASENEDISTPNEKALGRLVLEKYKTDFYFLTHYPAPVRPFYAHLATDEPHLTHSYDAFMRGQEIVSGAQRIHDPTKLIERMKSMDPPVNPEGQGFKYYVDAFKNGCAPHGGGGFGLNRILMLWLGLPNIRLATMFPRDPQRTEP